MRALLALAALLPLAKAPPTPEAPTTTPSQLVVLLGACGWRDPSAFSTQRLLAHAGLDRPPAELRVLGYDETCAGDEQRLTRALLSALGDGARVAIVGAGARGAGARGLRAACGASASLRRAAPAWCARVSAVAEAASLLASGLRWRRALLPPPPPGPCLALVSAVHSSLLLTGLQVWQHSSSGSTPPSPYAHITCSTPEDSSQSAENTTNAVPLTLRLRSDADTQRYYESKSKSEIHVETPNLTTELNRTLPAEAKMKATNVGFLLKADFSDFMTPSVTLTDIYDEALNEVSRQIEAEKLLKETVNTTLRLVQWVDDAGNGPWRTLVTLTISTSRSLRGLEEWASTVDVGDKVVYEGWLRAHAIDHDELTNVGGAGGDKVEGGAWGTALAVTGGVAALGAMAALGARAHRRRHQRRRRADVVLDMRDFAFPAHDELRVGDGMEAMLSCWLQQLHEFGGPELERPDLLKRASPKAPQAQAAPLPSTAPPQQRVRFKGDAVQLKRLRLPAAAPALELRSKATDVLLLLHSLRHENLNPFIGCLCELRPALVFDHCGRGSLEDVLKADDIKLDWTFRLSLLTDLVKGLRYLHGSALRVHGRLSSRNCVVDSRWVLRITDYGVPELLRAQGLSQPPRSARELLWTAPELLRENRDEGRGTQPGDIFSFAIIMQEVIVRGEPYCMLALSPEEIVEKLVRPPPLIRPSVSMGAAPPEAVSVMRQCWAEPPDLRPSTDALLAIFRHLHLGRKINIVDSMFEMLEKYSNNLEELIKERTQQLDMEKKKTEQLLNRMLPRSVAERLLLGLRVEPEEFEEVTVYFSDIVGFTALAARSTPVQVVALLNDLYTTFDAAIERYHVYKVETIGDAYMVVGGLPSRAKDHAESVATMALHLLHLAGRFRVRHLPAQPLLLRIGLHSGPCCAGVVGRTMPRYCLFGDTVNTASRMESTGAAWRIQTSAATAERLQRSGLFRLRERGLTPVKGKGAMRTFWLLGKEGFDKTLPTPPPLTNEEAENTLLESSNCAEATGEPPAPLSPVPPPASPDPSALFRASSEQGESSAAAMADRNEPYARYRCLGGERALRRQWSLELEQSEAPPPPTPPAPAPSPAPSPTPPQQPLALLLPTTAPPRAPRYRTRCPSATTVCPPSDADAP